MSGQSNTQSIDLSKSIALAKAIEQAKATIAKWGQAKTARILATPANGKFTGVAATMAFNVLVATEKALELEAVKAEAFLAQNASISTTLNADAGAIIQGSADALTAISNWAQAKKNREAAAKAGANALEIARLGVEERRLELQAVQAQVWLAQNPPKTGSSSLGAVAPPSSKKWIWIVGGIAATGAIATAIWYFVFRKK